MTATKLTRRSDLADVLAGTPTAFQNSTGSLHGEPTNGTPSHSGRLPDSEYGQFRADRPTFVVYSYQTAIAWKRSDGTWYLTGTKYSATTSQHVSALRRGLRYQTVR